MNFFQSFKYIVDAVAAKVAKVGDTMTGHLTLPGGGAGNQAGTVAERDAAIAAAAGAGDNGEVAIFDSNGKLIRSGKNIALDYSFSTDDELISGADPRMGVEGGLSLQGNAGSEAGFGYATSLPINGDFTFTCTVIPRYTIGNFSGIAEIGGIAFGLGFDSVGLGNPARVILDNTGSSFGWNTGFTCGELVGKKLHISLIRTGSTMSAMMNGVILTQSGTPTAPISSTITRICGGIVGGYGQLQGEVKDMKLFNKALTQDEIIKVGRGEIPAELARQALIDTTNVFSEWIDDNNRLTVSGNSFTKTAGAEVGALVCAAKANALAKLPFKPGEVYRAIYNCSLSSGNAADLPILIVGDYSTQVRVLGRLQVGARVSVIFIPEPGGSVIPYAQYASLNWGDVYGGTSGATSFTFDLISVERIGTVEHFAPDQVTSLARWIGKFGTDLVSGGGVTPLNPQPIKERLASCAMNLATSAVLNAGPTGWGTPSKASTGKISWPLPAYLPAANVINIEGSPSNEASNVRTSMSGSNAQAEFFQAGVATDDSNARMTVRFKE